MAKEVGDIVEGPRCRTARQMLLMLLWGGPEEYRAMLDAETELYEQTGQLKRALELQAAVTKLVNVDNTCRSVYESLRIYRHAGCTDKISLQHITVNTFGLHVERATSLICLDSVTIPT